MIRTLAALGLAASLSGCGYNQFQTLDEQVNASSLIKLVGK